MSALAAGRFVVIEGLDGSGKSTLARLLAAELGARVMTTPRESVRAVRSQVIAGLAASPVARQAFYLATVEAASEEIRAAGGGGQSVGLDRYLLSTMVYAQTRGEHLRWPALEDRLVPADVTLFVDLPLAVRRARLEARGMSAADVETLDPAFDREVRRRYLCWATHRVAGRFVSLRLTGNEGPDQVAQMALHALRSTPPPLAEPPAGPLQSRGSRGSCESTSEHCRPTSAPGTRVGIKPPQDAQ